MEPFHSFVRTTNQLKNVFPIVNLVQSNQTSNRRNRCCRNRPMVKWHLNEWHLAAGPHKSFLGVSLFKPWSSGYGMRLAIWWSWVLNPSDVYCMDIFSHKSVEKNVCLKNNEKKVEVHFLIVKMHTLNEIHPPPTPKHHHPWIYWGLFDLKWEFVQVYSW